MKLSAFLEKFALLFGIWIISEIYLITIQSWIAFICLGIIFIGLTNLMFKVVYLIFRGDWINNVDLSCVDKKWIQIPATIENSYQPERENASPYYWGAVYKLKMDHKVSDQKQSSILENLKPYIILAHGMGGSLEEMELMAVPLAMNGYNVVSFNQTGHGLNQHHTPGDGRNYVHLMPNIHDVVEFILTQSDLARDVQDRPQIGFIGGSTGGIMALTQAYLNSNIKMTIAISHIHDYREIMTQTKHFSLFSPTRIFAWILKSMHVKLDYTEEENRIISPKQCLKPDPDNAKRVFLVHCKDDPLPFEDALKSKALGQIPDSNCLFLERGGHVFRGQETIVTATIMRWLMEYL